MIRSRIATLLLSILSVAACTSRDSSDTARPESEAPWAPARLTAVKGVPATAIEASLKQQLAGPAPAQINEDQWGHTRRLYKVYGNNPLWLAPDGLHSDRAYALATAVLQAEQDGMRMDAYPIGALAQAMSIDASKTVTAQQLADADVTLTAAFVALGEDYLTGQVDPKTVAQSWHIDPQEENVDSALTRGLRNSAIDKAIASMRPQDPDYFGLAEQLNRFQQIVAKGGWPTVPAGKPVKPGESMDSPRIAALRQRLTIEGFSAAGASDSTQTTRGSQNSPAKSGVYSPALAGAVAQFQARHGIVVDSMLGDETLASLNQPATYRAAQIAANLERIRWLPRTLAQRYIYVNVPAFRLEAFDRERRPSR